MKKKLMILVGLVWLIFPALSVETTIITPGNWFIHKDFDVEPIFNLEKIKQKKVRVEFVFFGSGWSLYRFNAATNDVVAGSQLTNNNQLPFKMLDCAKVEIAAFRYVMPGQQLGIDQYRCRIKGRITGCGGAGVPDSYGNTLRDGNGFPVFQYNLVDGGRIKISPVMSTKQAGDSVELQATRINNEGVEVPVDVNWAYEISHTGAEPFVGGFTDGHGGEIVPTVEGESSVVFTSNTASDVWIKGAGPGASGGDDYAISVVRFVDFKIFKTSGNSEIEGTIAEEANQEFYVRVNPSYLEAEIEDVDWSYSVPAGVPLDVEDGNGEDATAFVAFTNQGSKRTKIKRANWFSESNRRLAFNELGENDERICAYTIKASVIFGDDALEDEIEYKVEFPLKAAVTPWPRFDGMVEIAEEKVDGKPKFTVIGMGGFRRVNPSEDKIKIDTSDEWPDEVYIRKESKFFNKVMTHEKRHVKQWNEDVGLSIDFSQFWNAEDFYQNGLPGVNKLEGFTMMGNEHFGLEDFKNHIRMFLIDKANDYWKIQAGTATNRNIRETDAHKESNKLKPNYREFGDDED